MTIELCCTEQHHATRHIWPSALGSIVDVSFCLSVVCKRSCVLCDSYQVRKVGTNRQLSLRLQAME